MDVSDFQPLNENIFVKLVEEDQVTPGNLTIPKSMQSKLSRGSSEKEKE